MRYNERVTTLTTREAFKRLRDAANDIDRALAVDRGSVRWRDTPVPGVLFGLALGAAHALMFMPSGDIAGPDWADRLPGRIEAARRYLLGFPRPAR